MAVRWYHHTRDLNQHKHHSYRLQSDWSFYGAPNFRFSVLEECQPAMCIEREQHYIDTFNPEYNVCRIAGSCLGKHHTPESLAKMSAAHKGHHPSPETRAKLSAAGLGKRPSHETRAKIRSALMGREITPAWRAKIKANHKGMKGMRHTPETKVRMRSAWARRRLKICLTFPFRLSTVPAT